MWVNSYVYFRRLRADEDIRPLSEFRAGVASYYECPKSTFTKHNVVGAAYLLKGERIGKQQPGRN
ncbi:hypothetical protein HH1059_19850 [Halorhodospira halochloris]|uniref:Uncharacterized protein n=1 Tax=Halorhodospira halochloris TaxID=1052 RepID=A0A110B2G7_HALHR|nr:hypothetical protein [Halorhodospira halochloris]BAU58690.1 hypothetical protein HH1059_19850 [Halorhodospira halochloris]